MKAFFLGVLALVTSVSWGAPPATQPTTRESAVDAVARLDRTVADAKTEEKAAKDAAMKKIQVLPEYKLLATKVETAKKAWDAARNSGPIQSAADAGMAWNKVNGELAEFTTKKLNDDSPTVRASKAVVDAQRQLAEARVRQKADIAQKRDDLIKAAEEREANDPIKAAIREGRIIKGMTPEEAHLAFQKSRSSFDGSDTSVTEGEDGSRVFTWRVLRRAADGIGVPVRVVTVVVRNDKVVSFSDSK